jgi:hypothetical protein
VRSTLFSIFRGFGSFLAFVIRFTGYTLGTFQKSSLQNSMIKKLYSAEQQEEEKENDTPQPSLLRQITDTDREPKEKLANNISSRRIISQSYWRGFQLRHFSSALCCCCRVKPGRDDFLYSDANKKLNEEIDLLEIVKKLRVTSFCSEIVLKPH